MDNRQTLLACAEDLFARRGYDAVGVQEIAETAGVTKPTLYYYFGSKKGLLEAILKERWAVLDARMADALAGTGDVACRLRQLAGACAGFFAEHRQFHLLLMSLLYSPRENESAQTARPYLDGFYRSVVAVFENIISFVTDSLHWTRRRAVIVNILALSALSLHAASMIPAASSLIAPRSHRLIISSRAELASISSPMLLTTCISAEVPVIRTLVMRIYPPPPRLLSTM